MNFSQVIGEGEVVVELKYCERCGGLWLRPMDGDESYCEGCRAAMAAWPRMGRATKKHNQGGPFGLVQGRHEGARRNAFRAEGHQELVIETLLGVAEDPVCGSELEEFTGLEEVRV